MERSQSRLSLSASFEALAIYFPCMNSFDEEDAVLKNIFVYAKRAWRDASSTVVQWEALRVKIGIKAMQANENPECHPVILRCLNEDLQLT
ncbi:UNVERIFIED_CONTAM: hypothetical protein H355_013943 [Colinus virginianus]|nr:hypothetical protein H355_013943 [Colinus virginianus]